jgi:hypothetical protein
MHIHGSHLTPNTLNLYSAVAAEKADSAKRAAEVRKKLIAGASELEDELDANAIVEESREFPPPHQDQEDPPAKTKQNANHAESNAADNDGSDVANNSPPDEPISMWG